jgi:tRNA threonylcarbamoyladenosine biosynthesis protein TsaE
MAITGELESSFRFLAGDEPDTARLGAALAAALRPGDVLALNGSLGAGKTRLVQAVAAALGFADQIVNSPTFVLIHEYDSRVPLYHVDAYRLRDSDEFLSIGGDEVLAGDRACLIEWADRIADLLPRDHLRIDIRVTGDTQREFRLAAHGPRAAALVQSIRAQLGQK